MRVQYGDDEVPLLDRRWPSAGIRRWWHLQPGETWSSRPVPDPSKGMYEHVAEIDGVELPPGVTMAAELMAEGADWAYSSGVFGGELTLVDHTARCVAAYAPKGQDEGLRLVPRPSRSLVVSEAVAQAADGAVAEVAEPLVRANGGLKGFPDVVAALADTVILREMKLRYRDKLSKDQHDFARSDQRLLGQHLDLAPVEWG